MKNNTGKLLLIAALTLLLSACGAQENRGGGTETNPGGMSQNGKAPAGSETAASTPAAETVDVWEDASPGSALSISVFEGQEGWAGIMFRNQGSWMDKLKAVPAVKAGDFTPEQMSWPVYSLEAGSRDGNGLIMIWTNGYLIDRHGQAYTFPFDFTELVKKENWEHIRSLKVFNAMSGSRYLLEQDGKWLFERMQAVQEEAVSDKVEMRVTEKSDSQITVQLKNLGTTEVVYGREYWLEVFHEGKWYHVPVSPEKNWAFTAEGYGLPPGESREMSHPLEMYGTLPPGRYRLGKQVVGEQSSYGEFEIQ